MRKVPARVAVPTVEPLVAVGVPTARTVGAAKTEPQKPATITQALVKNFIFLISLPFGLFVSLLNLVIHSIL